MNVVPHRWAGLRIHPAILLLLRFQALARLRRLTTRLLAPRRVLLTVLAAGLAVFWLGNAALSIVLREPMDPATLRRGVSLGLLLYTFWHLLKLVYSRPEAGIEWTPAEEALLCAKPLARRDLVLYRFLVIVGSAAFKAGIFALLMLPDLPMPLFGFVGALLALLLLDLLRMSFEIVAWGVSNRAYQRLRGGVALLAAAACIGVMVMTVSSPATADARQSAGGFRMLWSALGSVSQLADTPAGRILQAPFSPFVQVLLAERCDLALAGWLILALGIVGVAGYVTLRLDGYFLRVAHDRERAAISELERVAARETTREEIELQRLPRCGGAAAILWRQLHGARRHASGLVIALALPAGLSCIPWLADSDSTSILWNVTGALAFYSVLLLPTALKFDFQRDLDRMALIKALPVRPLAVVLAQLATPVLLASALQLAVLAATVVTQGANPMLALAAWWLLVTLNVMIFGFDNLVFLWFPHRLKQEGLFIFLRTTLVFTAKGLTFAAALAAVVAWANLSPLLADLLGIPGNLLFFAGLWALMAAAASLLVRFGVAAFVRFDPSADLPA